MFNNIFRKYEFDDLYIGVVTVYRNKNKKPSFVKVEVPPGIEKVSYVTIIARRSGNNYYQIDNEQPCFYYDNQYKEYSNFPVLTNVMSLREFYEKYYNKTEFVFEPRINVFMRKRIIEDATERKMVI